MQEIMDAISIQQPWAWCIVMGYKGVENRDWNTKKHGGIVGVAILEGVVDEPFIAALRRDGKRKEWTDWFFGKFGFVMANAMPVSFTPCKGQLGIFKAKMFDQQAAA